MNRKQLLFITILIFALAIFSYKVAFAFFSSQATSNNNTFTAAEVFATPTPVPPTVKISEVQITGDPGDAGHDFVEFYNPTSTPFDLNGHRLVKRSGSSPNDTTIKSWTTTAIVPAHRFYLWASTDDGFNATVSADTATAQNIGNNNSIALRFGAEDTGIIIDALSWNSASESLKEGTEFDPDPGANQSIERKALSTSTSSSMAIGGSDELKGNGFDLNNNATDFILRTVSQPQNTSNLTESP